MANRNAPSGFSPVKSITGADWNGQTNQYYVPSTDTSAFFIGDLIQSAAGASNGVVLQRLSVGVPQVEKCAAGASPCGVIIGFVPDVVSLPTFLPATKTKSYLLWVADDPQLIFEIQGDNTTTLGTDSIGKFADFTVATPTNNVGVSATVLATTTIAANAALPLLILGLAGGDFSAYCRFLVSLNLHELG